MPPTRSLVLGGARSGKSRHAESLLAGHPHVRYVATGYPPAGDPDWAERVRRHQQRRPVTWSTVETLDVAALLAVPDPPLLIDCMGLWLTRVIDSSGDWDAPDLGGDIQQLVDDTVAAWSAATGTVVAVSSEVGMGVVPATRAGQMFRDALGDVNRRLARACDSVWLVVAGIPVRIK